MTSHAEEPVTPKRPWRRRVLATALAVLGVLEVVYVVGGLVLLKSGQVERWINAHPEKTKISFDSVWPIVPGVVRIRDFRIVNQGRGDQLEGTVENVWGAVNPLELLAGRLHVVWLRCRGVEFRLRNRPASAGEAATFPVGLPKIEGVPWVPYDGPPPDPNAKRKEKKGLTIVFTRSHLADVRDVQLGTRRLTGQGTVVASVTIHGDGPIEIPYADVRFENARIENGPDETYSGIRMEVLGELARYDAKSVKGLGILSLIRARVDVDARMPSGAAWLNVYLRNAPWLRFTGGETTLSAHLSVVGGKLAPGGYVEVAPHDLTAEFAGFAAHGKAGTRLDVVGSEKSLDARLAVTFDTYDLRRGKDAPAAVMDGKGLRIEVTTPASLAALPPTEFAGRLDLGNAEFPRLDFLNALFPAGGGFRIRGGRAKVGGAFDVAGSGSSCRGSMKIAAEGLSLDTGGVAMKGAFTLGVEVPSGDLLKQAFDVDATRLTLDRFGFDAKHAEASDPDWSASVAFPKASLALGQAFGVKAILELRASDSRPIAAFLSKDKPLSGWKKKLVTFGEIRGTSRFSLAPGKLVVEDFVIGWEGTEVRARFRTDETGVWGKALARYGILKAGISLEGKERSLKVIRPVSWYEKP